MRDNYVFFCGYNEDCNGVHCWREDDTYRVELEGLDTTYDKQFSDPHSALMYLYELRLRGYGGSTDTFERLMKHMRARSSAG